jgi:type VI secretion system secreted protein Hcp
MAAVDYFLVIEGVEGETQDAQMKAKKAIEVQSWSFGETQSGSMHEGSGGGCGKVSMQDFHFTMKVNKASPKLFLACATGEHFKKAQLFCRKAGKQQETYLTWTFTDLMVSSYQTGGSAGSDIVPVDQISLNFAKVEVEYKEQKPDGSLGGKVAVGYDLKANKAA